MELRKINKIVQNKRKIGWVDFKNKKVLVHTERKEITILDDVGKEIWDICERPNSPGHIVKILSSRFSDTDSGFDTGDINKFLIDLMEKELLIKY